MSIAIKSSVGAGGINDPLDVVAVQCGLNMIHFAWGGPKTDLDASGKSNQNFINAIRRFQKHNFGKNGAANSKIEPGDRTLQKINQVLGGEIDLVMLGPMRKKNDDGILAAAKCWESEIPFSGYTNMVDLILKAMNSDPTADVKIKSLIIISHGQPGVARWSTKAEPMQDLVLSQLVYAPYKDYPPDDLAYFATDDLMRLRGKFTKRGLVTLYACRIAASTEYGKDGEYNQPFGEKEALHKVDGRNLLKGVSKALGNVAVQGSGDVKIRERPTVAGMEGQPIYRCDSHHCSTISNIYETYWAPEFEEGDAFWDHHQEDLRAELKKVEAEPDPGKKKGLILRLRDKIRSRRK